VNTVFNKLLVEFYHIYNLVAFGDCDELNEFRGQRSVVKNPFLCYFVTVAH